MGPAVSVIMPVRDGGRYLAAAVASILGQTLAELELIVVDDHSRDGAIEALDRSDRRLRIVSSAGAGVSSAFNTGIAAARAPLVARMDADDIAEPDRLKRQSSLLADDSRIGICGAEVEIFADTPLRGGNRRYQSWLNACRTPIQIRRQMFIESPIPNPTAMFRREVLAWLGGYREPAWPEDYDLFLRADRAGVRMAKPAGVLLRWRDHRRRLTRKSSRYDLRRFQVAKAHYLARGRLGTGEAPVIWGAGPTGRLMHDLLQAEGVRARGFLEVDAKKIGGRKRGLPVWPLERLGRLDGVFVLVAVGSAGARRRIRAYLEGAGRVEGESYLFVA